MFNDRVQVILLVLDDIIALRAMDMFSKYSRPPPVRAENPQEVWDAFCGGWLGTFGSPESIQMGEGGEWQNEMRTD